MTNTTTPLPASPGQLQFVGVLQRKHRLSDAALDTYCRETFGGRPLAELSRREVSQLLDAMVAWEQVPAELQRALGQQDLPGLEIGGRP